MLPLPVQKLLQQRKDRLRHDIDHCILCRRCLKVCPATGKDTAEMNELLFTLENKSEEPRGPLKRFVLNCSQCGLCSEVCPQGNRFDLMVQACKDKIRDLPDRYTLGTALKRQNPSLKEALRMKAIYLKRRKQLGDLSLVLDKIPPKTEKLLYLGEHILLPSAAELQRQTDVPAMGGLKLASGYDSLVQGQWDDAFNQFEVLNHALQRAVPSTVIVPSLATYEAISFVQYMHNREFSLLSALEWLKMQELTLKPPKKIAVYHNPWLRKLTQTRIQDVFGRFCNILDVDEKNEFPVMEYNYDVDEANATKRHNLIAQARTDAECLVVDCALTAQVLRKAVTKENALAIYDVTEFVARYGQ